MKFFVVVAALVALGNAAPSGYGYTKTTHLGRVPVGPAVAHTVPAGPPVANVHETVHAGPAIARTEVQHGVVGHRTVQVGSRTIQVGSEAYVAGQSVEPQPAYTYVAHPGHTSQNTVPLPEPALPVASPAAAYAAIPGPAVNYGPAPADTVTQEVIKAPVRTHTRITPRLTRIEPRLQVNKVPYDVPVHVPIPQPREVIVQKNVPRPYNVDVPRPVPVAKPYKVHPVHEVVETPVVNKHTVSVSQPVVNKHTQVVSQPVVAGYATQAHTVPVAAGYATTGVVGVAAPAAAVGYGAVGAVAPAAAVGYGAVGAVAAPAAVVAKAAYH